MKTITLFILLLCSALVIQTTACKSPVKTLYRAESTANVTVESALKAWGDYVAKYHPGVVQEAKVKAALEKYKTAMSYAVTVSQRFSELKNAQTEAEANDAYFKAAESLSDFYTLLKSFGVKL